MRRKTNFRIFFLLIIALLVARNIYSYRSTYHYSLTKRAEIAAQLNKDIHVAIVWDLKNESSFVDGVTLAINEINKQGILLKSANKTVNAQIVLHQFDDSTKRNARKSRLTIAADHKIVAVLGHSSSASAIPASITYEYNGVLFISVVATDSMLTEHGFKYTFSIIPSEDLFVDTIIQFTKKKNWNNLVFLHARNQYGLDLYDRFAARLEAPLQIVEAKSFFIEHRDYKNIIYEVMKKDFDAVVLAAVDRNAAIMIKELRKMGVNTPILGGDGLDNFKIWDWSGQTSNQTYVASVFAGQDSFRQKFKQFYGMEADYYAYQGYEAAHVLADAIRKTGTSEPIRVASTLKYNYVPGYGNYEFDIKGLVSNKMIYIKQMQDGKFVQIEQE